MIIQQYRKDIIEAKVDYRLLKEKHNKLKKFVEKQSEDLKNIITRKNILKKK